MVILYHLRNAVERLINRLKQFRRIATRYEKRAENYHAMLLSLLSCYGYSLKTDPSPHDTSPPPNVKNSRQILGRICPARCQCVDVIAREGLFHLPEFVKKARVKTTDDFCKNLTMLKTTIVSAPWSQIRTGLEESKR